MPTIKVNKEIPKEVIEKYYNKSEFKIPKVIAQAMTERLERMAENSFLKGQVLQTAKSLYLTPCFPFKSQDLKEAHDPNKEMIDRDQFISVSSSEELNGKSERSVNHWSCTVAPMSFRMGFPKS